LEFAWFLSDVTSPEAMIIPQNLNPMDGASNLSIIIINRKLPDKIKIHANPNVFRSLSGSKNEDDEKRPIRAKFRKPGDSPGFIIPIAMPSSDCVS